MKSPWPAAARILFASLVVIATATIARAQPHPPTPPHTPDTLELGGSAAAANAQSEAAPAPAPTSRRLVHRFDFEETDDSGLKLGRGYPMPPHWYAIGRDPQIADPAFDRRPWNHALATKTGFPAYTQVGYDTARQTSGDFALRLGLDGGSAGAFLEVGALPAIPGSDYRITAKVRTHELHHAAAEVTACLIDAQGRPIPRTTARSGPLRPNDQWTTVSLRLVGEVPRAAWIGLTVQLRQPRASAANPLGQDQVVLQDIHGQAWFDDIGIWQMPHATMSTQSPVNLIRAPDQPRLDMSVRDLTGRRLMARVDVYDLHHHRVASTTRPVGADRADRWHWIPDLPAYGWYLSELTVYEQGGGSDGSPSKSTATSLVRASSAFAWLGPDAALPLTDAARFRLDAHDADPKALDLLPRVLDATGLRSVLIPAWQRDTTLKHIDRRRHALNALVNRLAKGGRKVAMSLEPIPDELVHTPGVEANTALGVLRADPSRWLGYVVPVLTSQGQRVHHWQLGVTAPPAAPAAARLGPARGISLDQPDLAGVVTGIRDQLRDLAPGPRVVLPGSVLATLPAAIGQDIGYALNVPPGVGGTHLSEYLKPWQARRDAITLGLSVPDGNQLDPASRVNALVRQMLGAWEAGPLEMSLARSWTARHGHRETELLPGPLLPAFVNTAHRLAGRRVVGRVNLGPGLKAMVLDRPAGGDKGAEGAEGMLAAWADRAPDGGRTVTMSLGKHPVAVDVWGNRTPLPTTPTGKQRLTLTSTPTFIENINPRLAQFRAAFKLNDPFIESLQIRHQRTLHLTNPWKRTISGSFRITGPDRWTIRPQRYRFSIPAGGSLDMPVSLGFPVSGVAGPKKLTARFDFFADRRYHVDLATPMTLGMHDLRLVASLSLNPAGGDKAGGRSGGANTGQSADQGETAKDAVVHLVVTNTSDRTRSLYLFASLPGFARSERPVPRLKPGQSVIRTFRFPDALPSLQQYPVRCGVRESNGPAVLNQKLNLDQAF